MTDSPRGPGLAATGELGLYTDLYELRMVSSYLKQGMTGEATFSLFVRPAAVRPWYVALGMHRLPELFDNFRFGSGEVDYLRAQGIDEGTLRWLEAFRPTGEVWAVPEGSVVLAQEPIVEVTAPLPVAQVLETAVINLIQYPTLVATKAARCALAAGRRQLADFGFRRAHGLETGVHAALAAYVGGGFSTSNLEAGRRYAIPVSGTMAHSYVQAFPDETEAFRCFAADNPEHIILLVDTYDTLDGVRRAITVANELKRQGRQVQGIRLDSGNLATLAAQARTLLDDTGHPDIRIVASGSLDEYRIAELVDSGAPIDAFGVGSALAVSTDHPALDIVYKLVDYQGRAVAKFSGVKSTLPGRKQVYRPDQGPTGDVLSARDSGETGRPLLEPVWRDGEVLCRFDTVEARERVGAELARLPADWALPPYPEQPPLPKIGSELDALAEHVRRDRFGT